MTKRPDVHLELALNALERVPRFLANRTLKDYLADDYCQSAVERQLEVAGDALGQVRKLDPNLFARIPDGALIVAFRNVLAHGYATLDHRRVFDAATVETGSNRGQAETAGTLPRASTAGDYSVLGYQLRIHLRGISPPIWRRVLIAAESTIADLHDIMQLSMGWSDDSSAQLAA